MRESVARKVETILREPQDQMQAIIQDIQPYQLTISQIRYLRFKRFMDTAIAFFSLLFLAIPFLLMAIIQKINSPSEPVFFRQVRIGQNEKPFTILKFRTMSSSAPSELSTEEFCDAEFYLTKLGQLLRNTSIDELPQLWNVLIGEMSLIGPRPLIVREEYVHNNRSRVGVYQVKPGLTGLAQIHGRDYLPNEQKVLYDALYIRNLGFLQDTAIFVRSFQNVIMRRDIRH